MDIPPQDQVVIQQICDIAAMSPSIARQTRAAISGWCVQWEVRMEKEKPQETKKK